MAQEGRVVAVDISTPLTIENYLRSGKGAAIGLDVTPARFVDEDEAALPGRCGLAPISRRLIGAM